MQEDIRSAGYDFDNDSASSDDELTKQIKKHKKFMMEH